MQTYSLCREYTYMDVTYIVTIVRVYVMQFEEWDSIRDSISKS